MYLIRTAVLYYLLAGIFLSLLPLVLPLFLCPTNPYIIILPSSMSSCGHRKVSEL